MIISPAANNACIDLIPERVGMITGLRGMFRQTGSAISIAITTVVLQNFALIGRGFTVMFYALAAAMLVTVPTIFAMPKAPSDKHGRGKDYRGKPETRYLKRQCQARAGVIQEKPFAELARQIA